MATNVSKRRRGGPPVPNLPLPEGGAFRTGRPWLRVFDGDFSTTVRLRSTFRLVQAPLATGRYRR